MGAATDDMRLRQPLTVRLGVALVKRLVEPAIDNLIGQIEGLGSWTSKELDRRDQVIGRLQARLAELEQRQAEGMRYAGIWEAGSECQAGDVTTHAGTVWYAHEATTDKPGTTAAWQMMAKSR